jgi:Rieske Fe-S protein
MPGEDQERVEDYLELERYIEELQAGHVAHLPENLTPEQARIYRMAALFRSATPEDAEPRPAFTEQLEARLLARLQSPSQEEVSQESVDSPGDKEQHEPPVSAGPSDGPEPIHSGTQHTSPAIRSNATRKRAIFTRRSVLAGAAAVAASLGIGAGVEYTIERTGNAVDAGNVGKRATKVATTFVWDKTTPLVGQVPTTWLQVASLAQLDSGAVRFVTDAVVGYVVHLVKTTEYPDQIIAVSAACTHMGCLVQWQNTDHRFHCPCHNGMFEASGEQVNDPNYAYTLAPLPRLKTKIENGHVYVEVPAKPLV